MDDEELRPKFAEWPPKSLDHLSVEALENYDRSLQAEMERVRRVIESRSKHRAAADSLFKS